MNEKILKAEYGDPEKPLKIGDLILPCYVLEDGRRVLVQTGMIKSLGMSQGTGSRSIEGGDRLTKFIDGKRLSPYIENKLSEMIKNPIQFKLPKGGISFGYEATILADICEAVLSARHDGRLQKQQLHIAKQCEILVRGFARVGIIALVDEATGFQAYRDRIALREFLEKYITDEWSKWTKTFPDEFYRELFRLKNIPYPTGSTTKPSYVGHWTNDIVYKRLAPNVLTILRQKNPVMPSGYRARKFFQHLTKDYGHPDLKKHLDNLVFLMKTCNTWNDFYSRLNRVAPKFGDTFPLDFEIANVEKKDNEQ
jgi:hypothetical protein